MSGANPNPEREAMLHAILPHVAFDGWSTRAFDAAAQDLGLSVSLAKAACPRGATDLLADFHKAGDRAMVDALVKEDLTNFRFRDKIARAIQIRLNVIDDKEAVRRGVALFSLPHLAPEGAALIWGTSDVIWTALGDVSHDVNYYTKRATLSAVYGAVVLYWLGDETEGAIATQAFIDRRIENVMQFETAKARSADHPITKPFARLIGQLTAGIKAPGERPRDVPGYWESPK